MNQINRHAGDRLRDLAIAVPALSGLAAAEDKGNRIFRIRYQCQGGTGS